MGEGALPRQEPRDYAHGKVAHRALVQSVSIYQFRYLSNKLFTDEQSLSDVRYRMPCAPLH